MFVFVYVRAGVIDEVRLFRDSEQAHEYYRENTPDEEQGMHEDSWGLFDMGNTLGRRVEQRDE